METGEIGTSKRIQVLKVRAEGLAKILEAAGTTAQLIEILVFKLGKEMYAIETKYIKEVFPLKDYTPLPCVPSFIYGLVNVRRRILSIFDLRTFLGLKAAERSEKKLVILEDKEMEFALLTDGFDGIQKIHPEQIQHALPNALTDANQDFLEGIISEKIILLNGRKLMSSKLIIVNESVEI